MKLTIAALLSTLPILGLGATSTTPIPPGPPIIGTWTFTLPNGCIERHTFDANGRMSGTSGQEYVEEDYTLSAGPDASGFYTLTGLTLKDTGGPDCGDSSEDHTGKSWTVYVRFSKDRQKYLSCAEATMEHCWGPYHRIQPPPAPRTP